MFPVYLRDAITYDEARAPQWQYTAYPVNNVEAFIQPTGAQDATQERRYKSNQGRLIDPNHQSISRPTGFHPTLPGPSRQPTAAEPNWTHMGYPSNRSVMPGPRRSQSFAPRRPEVATDDMPPMHPVNTGSPISSEATLQEWARTTAERFFQGSDPELEEELERAYNQCLRKRRRTPDPDPGAGPSQCKARSDVCGSEDPPRTRTRRRQETGDWAAARRAETQEQRVGRSPEGVNDKSKLGTQALSRSLVVPSQGVYPPLPPGATTTDATLGPTESGSQAWNEEELRTEDAHDEEETDRKRWERLMYREDGTWKCRGCGGKAFSDRSTLQRHCRSSVHAKHRDIRKCPHCTKEYMRQSGLNRHLKEKHGVA